jgi:hypothetical protein
MTCEFDFCLQMYQYTTQLRLPSSDPYLLDVNARCTFEDLIARQLPNQQIDIAGGIPARPHDFLFKFKSEVGQSTPLKGLAHL